MVCTNPEKSSDLEIYWVVRLATFSRYEIHHLSYIMLLLINDRNINLDFVPSGQRDSILSTLSEIFDDVILQNITNTDAFKTLNLLARHAISIYCLHHRESESLFLVKAEIYSVNVYISFIGIIIVFEIELKRKNVQMYEPKLAEVEVTQDYNIDNFLITFVFLYYLYLTFYLYLYLLTF